jgi:hypothetical protein
LPVWIREPAMQKKRTKEGFIVYKRFKAYQYS